ncbi:unnamed protein product [Rangifer tarandus platyrhynchus]|uniref:Uncharacterized protein n=2 Tax=Rangifer tarandus platyrhynchus TaxID=3082113 RepID=A0ABN8YE47_RANTA|nr:unnamed protein product [Rangifer tarandus platyrhynchus]
MCLCSSRLGFELPVGDSEARVCSVPFLVRKPESPLCDPPNTCSLLRPPWPLTAQWLSSKESTCYAGAAGDSGSIPGSGRPAGGGNGNPLQYSCLENPMDRGAWRATVHGVTKSQTRLSTHENVCTLL